MQIKDYTAPELDRFRRLCNFTARERELFDLRASGLSLEACGEEMDYSTGGIRYLSGQVKRKMNRV